MCQKEGKNGWLPLSYLRRGSFIREEDVLGFLCSEFATGVVGEGRVLGWDACFSTQTDYLNN